MGSPSELAVTRPVARLETPGPEATSATPLSPSFARCHRQLKLHSVRDGKLRSLSRSPEAGRRPYQFSLQKHRTHASCPEPPVSQQLRQLRSAAFDPVLASTFRFGSAVIILNHSVLAKSRRWIFGSNSIVRKGPLSGSRMSNSDRTWTRASSSMRGNPDR